MQLNPGDKFLDYSSARPDPGLMAARGGKGGSRYICQINELTRPKLLTIPERDRLFDQGISIQPNFEWYAKRTLEGTRAGAEDGRVCADMLAVLDWPIEHFVCISAGTDLGPSTWQATADYHAAFRAEIAPRPSTSYIDSDGGRFLLDRGLIDHPGIWAPGASGWNNIAPHTVYLQQWVGFMHPDLAVLGSVDDNTVKAPFELWAGEVSGGGTTPPIEEPEEMIRILHPDGRQFVCVGRDLEAIDGPMAYWIERKDGPPLTCRSAEDQTVLDQWIGSSALHASEEDAALDARIRAIVADEVAKAGGNGVSLAAIRSAVRVELDSTTIAGRLGK